VRQGASRRRPAPQPRRGGRIGRPRARPRGQRQQHHRHQGHERQQPQHRHQDEPAIGVLDGRGDAGRADAWGAGRPQVCGRAVQCLEWFRSRSILFHPIWLRGASDLMRVRFSSVARQVSSLSSGSTGPPAMAASRVAEEVRWPPADAEPLHRAERRPEASGEAAQT
jgi:hypothetical protein